MPPGDSIPLWLLQMKAVQRYTSVVAFLIVASTLVVYGWTVYSQQLWSQSFRRLQNLHRYERWGTINNAVQKEKIVNEGEKRTQAPTPEGQIFLQPAPLPPGNPQPLTENSQNMPPTRTPTGY